MRLGIIALIIVGSLALAIGLVALIVGPLLLNSIRTRSVLTDGQPAEARVLDLRDTGTRINYQPQIAITLEVMPEGRPAYTAVVRRVLTAANEAEYQRGKTLHVKYDPAHPERVAVVGPAG